MSLLNGSATKAQEVLNLCLASESPEFQAKIYQIINLSGLEPNDPMFLVLALTGQMRVFLEAAPEELGQLLNKWKIQSADSLAEIYSAVSLVQQTQQEQVEAIKGELESVSQKCVSDFKEAGMTTVGAIAEANSETLSQVQQTQRQIEELESELAQLNAKFDAREQKSVKSMNDVVKWAENITQKQEKVNLQINQSASGINKIQRSKIWLKIADAFWSLPALLIFTFILMGGTWLTASKKYNDSISIFGRELVEWNVDRINNCRETNNPKCTFWIVPPGSPERNE